MSEGIFARAVGWFDSPGQTLPANDPGEDAPCPVCGQAIGDRNDGAKSFSAMPAGRPICRSYFIYAHGSCVSGEESGEQLTGALMDYIEKLEAH